MNIKSILTTLALVAATSTVAMAKPIRVDDQAPVDANSWIRHTVDQSQTVVPYTPTTVHHYDQPAASPGYPARTRISYGRWWNPRTSPQLVISQPSINRAANMSTYVGSMGTVNQRSGFVALSQPTRIETIREGFDVSRSGRIGAVKLQAVQGTTSIKMIGVVYANGKERLFQVNQTINLQNPLTVALDLGGRRQIMRINVYGSSSANSAYKLLASAS